MTAPPTIEDLGVDGALYLLALLLAQAGRRTVTPTRKLTLQALGTLRDQGVIALPWPSTQWEVEPDAETTPMEELQWRYTWTAYSRPGLTEALSDYLQNIPCNEEGVELRVRLWRLIFRAECQQFLEFHLTRSHLPVEWALDTPFLLDSQSSDLSLGQWRYCLWAAVRQGGAMSAQKIHSDAAIRERVFEEAKRRAGAIASGRWTVQGFDPREDEPFSALSRAYLRNFARIGPAFFQQPPSPRPWLKSAAA